MSTSPIIQRLIAKAQRTDLPSFKPGDTVRVQVKIKEGDKERLQAFGHGVERIFPMNSRVIDKIDVTRRSEVRRAKLYYLRGLRGKAARLKELDTRTAKPTAAANA